MTNFKKFTLGALSAALLAVVAASPAGAATTVGIATTTNEPCAANSLHVSTTADYQLPSGVITSVSSNRGQNIAHHYSVKVVRPILGQTIVATTPLLTAQNAAATYLTRMSTKSGDRLGLWNVELQDCAITATTPLNTYATAVDPQPAATFTGPASQLNVKLSLTANVEADVDGDGFGDETQDGCPANPGRQAPPCATPAGPAPPTCKVPSLKAKSKSAAKKALEAAGCKLGSSKKKKLKKFTSKQKKNRVRSQTIKAGTTVPAGTSVGITVNVKKS